MINRRRSKTRFAALASDAFTNPNGAARVVTVDGTAIDPNNPFFQSLGTNGRACVNCHQPSAAMTITPPQLQAVFQRHQRHRSGFSVERRREQPENAPIATLDQKRAAYSLLLSKGLIRIPLTLPANRGFRRPGRAESLRQCRREPGPKHGRCADRDARAVLLPAAAAVGEHTFHRGGHVGRARGDESARCPPTPRTSTPAAASRRRRPTLRCAPTC